MKAYNKSHIFLLSPVQWQVKLDVLEEDTPFKATVNKTEVHRIFFLGILLRKVSTLPPILQPQSNANNFGRPELVFESGWDL